MFSPVQHDEETFEGKDGTKLFSQSWTSNGPRKATLIIVHGLHDHSSRYEWPAEELAKQGYSVYGFDLRGHGKSEGKPQWINSFNDYLEDLDRFKTIVHNKEADNPLFIFGFSMGGAIVASYALENKTGAKGVILCSPALKPPSGTGISVGILKLLGPLLPNQGTFRPASRNFSRDMKVVAEMEEDPMISKEPVPNRTVLGVIHTGEKILADTGKFGIPFLALQGTADKLVDPEGTKILYKHSQSTDKTLKIYEGFYHDLLHEPNKQTVLNDMSDWLGKRS